MEHKIDGRTREGRAVTRDENAGKPARIPIGAGNKLQFKGMDPGYEYRVVSDTDDRLQMFLDAGWEYCHSEKRTADKGIAEGSSMDSRRVVNAGRGVKGYLMRIRKELYEEDQARKVHQIRQAESQLRNPNPNPIKGQYAGLTDE